MIRMLMIRALLVAGAVLLAWKLSLAPALLAWVGVSAALCVVGAMLIASQPLATPTRAGFVGSCVVPYGYKVSQGTLPLATAISWLFWVIVGSAAILVFVHRHDPLLAGLIVSWLIITLLLMRLTGTILDGYRGQSAPTSLVKLVASLGVMLVASMALTAVGTPWSRWAALVIAGGPLAAVGGAYGLFVLAVLTVGRKAQWH